MGLRAISCSSWKTEGGHMGPPSVYQSSRRRRFIVLKFLEMFLVPARHQRKRQVGGADELLHRRVFVAGVGRGFIALATTMPLDIRLRNHVEVAAAECFLRATRGSCSALQASFKARHHRIVERCPRRRPPVFRAQTPARRE